MQDRAVEPTLDRDSVAAGDDVETPGERREVDGRRPLERFVAELVVEHYLPSIQGGRACWILRTNRGGTALGVVGIRHGRFDSLRLLEPDDPPLSAVGDSLYFEYATQQHPDEVFDQLVAGNWPRLCRPGAVHRGGATRNLGTGPDVGPDKGPAPAELCSDLEPTADEPTADRDAQPKPYEPGSVTELRLRKQSQRRRRNHEEEELPLRDHPSEDVEHGHWRHSGRTWRSPWRSTGRGAPGRQSSVGQSSQV